MKHQVLQNKSYKPLLLLLTMKMRRASTDSSDNPTSAADFSYDSTGFDKPALDTSTFSVDSPKNPDYSGLRTSSAGSADNEIGESEMASGSWRLSTLVGANKEKLRWAHCSMSETPKGFLTGAVERLPRSNLQCAELSVWLDFRKSSDNELRWICEALEKATLPELYLRSASTRELWRMWMFSLTICKPQGEAPFAFYTDDNIERTMSRGKPKRDDRLL